MNRNTDASVRLAAQACLVQCHQSLMPFTALADFLDELRRKDWSEAAISTVAFIVAKSLNGRDFLSRCQAGSASYSSALADL